MEVQEACSVYHRRSPCKDLGNECPHVLAYQRVSF